MDPSIMKFFEEDEDETMHSGAAVEAFTAALNKDIGGDTSTSQPSDSDSVPLSQGSIYTSSQLFPLWQSSSQDDNANGQNQQDLYFSHQQEQHSSKMELKQHGFGPGNCNLQIDASQKLNCISLLQKKPQDNCQQLRVEPNILHFSQAKGIQNSEKNPVHIREPDRTHNLECESQHPRLHQMNSRQTITAEQAMNPMKSGKQIPFGLLLPVLQLQLDKDRGMQLRGLYTKLKKNEISKDGFIRHVKAIVGDHMLKMAVFKVQAQAARNSQTGHNHLPLQSQASAQPQQASHGMPASLTSSSSLSDMNQEREQPVIPIQGLSKVQQQHLPFSQQPHDSQMRQGPIQQSIGATQFATSTQAMNALSAPKFERENSFRDPKRLQGGSLLPHNSVRWQSSTTKEQKIGSLSSMAYAKQEPVDQSNSQVPSATPPVGPGSNPKTLLTKPSIGRKRPLESLCSSPPSSSKEQNISGPSLDQSIDLLNDVTAVSGINLREEEEHLLYGPKEDSRVSEASRRVVQEEEKRLILQKIPIRGKVAEIISKCGLKSISNDVEQCLSLCVEERMHGLISNLIRLSKQRVDIEKPRHRTLITSDVQQQITAMNQKVREELNRKQTEVEELQRLNEPEGNDDVDGNKDEGRLKSIKANKEEDDKRRTTAANVAARAAVGGDDMLSKWQLMAEQARQKRDGGLDVAPGSQPGKDVSRKPFLTSGKNKRVNLEAEKKGQPTAAVTFGSRRKFVRNQVMVPQPKVTRSISIKDVIAVLQREPQMSKTTLIHQLYEKTHVDAVAE